MKYKYCNYCGKKIPSDALYCQHCGEEIIELTEQEIIINDNITINENEECLSKENIDEITDKAINKTSYSNKTKTIAIVIIGFISLLIIVLVIATKTTSSNVDVTTSNFDITNEELYEKETTDIDEYSARNKAVECVEENQYKLYQYKSNISRIDMLHIETIELNDENYSKAYHNYTFTIKGNFWGYNEYGNVEGKHTFDAIVKVHSDGSTYFDRCTTY